MCSNYLKTKFMHLKETLIVLNYNTFIFFIKPYYVLTFYVPCKQYFLWKINFHNTCNKSTLLIGQVNNVFPYEIHY